MQTGGGLVQDVERAARGPLGQLTGQLDALGFAAGEGGGRLTQFDVAEPDIHQGVQDTT
jgi:hypothetical protein